MNRNRLFFIGLVALMLGAFVSLLVYKNLQKPGGPWWSGKARWWPRMIFKWAQKSHPLT